MPPKADDPPKIKGTIHLNLVIWMKGKKDLPDLLGEKTYIFRDVDATFNEITTVLQRYVSEVLADAMRESEPVPEKEAPPPGEEE